MSEKLPLGSVRGLCRDSAVTSECILVCTGNTAAPRSCDTQPYACPGSETMPHFVLFMVTHTDSPSRTIGCIRQRAAAANLRSSSTGKVFSFIAIPCK
jgi:hypothetical protein